MARAYTKEWLQQLVDDSVSIREVLIKAGRSPNGGGGYETLKRKFQEFEIDTSHFLGQTANQGTKHTGGPKEKYDLNEVFIKNSTVTQKTLRDYVERHHVIEYRCCFCGCDGHWLDGEIKLDLDHINGDNKDDRVENLRYLCPNCHALTDTYRGRNKKK